MIYCVPCYGSYFTSNYVQEYMDMLHSHEEEFTSWEMPTAHIAAGENTSSQSSKMKQSKNSFSILPIEDRQRARKSHLSTQSAARGLWLGECWYGFFFAFPSSIPKDNSMNTGLVFTCFPIRWQPKLFFIGAKHNKIPRLSKKKKKPDFCFLWMYWIYSIICQHPSSKSP